MKNNNKKHGNIVKPWIVFLCFFVSFLFIRNFASHANNNNNLIPEERRRNFARNNSQFVENEDFFAEEIIREYLEAREENLTLEEIAVKRFKVSFPNANSRDWPHSYPFLTGDTLKSFADFVFERRTTVKNLIFNYNKWVKIGPNRDLEDGDVIFVKGDESEHFFIEAAPGLKSKFILVSHNSAVSVPAKGVNLENPLLIHWFGQNAVLRPNHPKVTPIPIGLENRKLKTQHGNIAQMEPFLRNLAPVLSEDFRPIDAYVNFNSGHHESRKKAEEAFRPYSFKVGIPPPITQRQYLEHLSKSKFVVSPRGTGEDCHRTWESVLFKAVPVVQNSTLWSLFKEAPVKVVNDGFEAKIPLSDLRRFKPATLSRKLMMAQYWFDLINERRRSS